MKLHFDIDEEPPTSGILLEIERHCENKKLLGLAILLVTFIGFVIIHQRLSLFLGLTKSHELFILGLFSVGPGLVQSFFVGGRVGMAVGGFAGVMVGVVLERVPYLFTSGSQIESTTINDILGSRGFVLGILVGTIVGVIYEFENVETLRSVSPITPEDAAEVIGLCESNDDIRRYQMEVAQQGRVLVKGEVHAMQNRIKSVEMQKKEVENNHAFEKLRSPLKSKR